MPQPGSGPTTRDAIHAAATRLFRERGFAGTTVRQIAAAAEADPALVIRHFGSKELLFLGTMHLTLDDEPVLDVPLEQLGERFVAMLLDLDDLSRGVFVALLRGSNEPHIAERLRETHEATFVEPLRARLAGPDADIRARVAGTLIAGLLYGLWIVQDDHLLATDHDELVSRYGALLQDILTPHP